MLKVKQKYFIDIKETIGGKRKLREIENKS